MNERLSSSTGSAPAVGYVVTHYPKLAQTFIASEILAVENAGRPIRIFAMNPPDAAERNYPDAACSIARTTYLKPAIWAGIRALLIQSLRHPVGMSRVWQKALTSGGGSPSRTARRLSHLVQAALVSQHALRDGITRLHAHFGLAPATISWLAADIMRASGSSEATFSFTVHGFHDFINQAESRLDLKAEDATLVICISDFTRSQLCLVSPPKLWPKFRVVRCGVDCAALPYRDPPPLRSEPRLVAIGRLSSEKGYGILLEALVKVRGAGINARLQIIGDGPERAWLETRIAALKLGGIASLAGELEPCEVKRELADSDVFVMASFSEGLPISIMEAMAIGVPVVTTWIAGIPELASNGETALTVAPADPDGLAQAIMSLLGEESRRLTLARAARARVEVQHDLARTGQALAHLFELRVA